MNKLFAVVMCYFLFIGSPLTLSEVRSMLPSGITADALAPADQRVLHALHSPAATAARLLLGACSCDLVLPRRPDGREAERHLRRRGYALGLSRPDVIACLDAHRRDAEPRFESPAAARAGLATFVAEHARNAGPTLYLLRFGHDPLHRRPPAARPAFRTSDGVTAQPDGWLVDEQPVVVTRAA